MNRERRRTCEEIQQSDECETLLLVAACGCVCGCLQQDACGCSQLLTFVWDCLWLLEARHLEPLTVTRSSVAPNGQHRGAEVLCWQQ